MGNTQAKGRCVLVSQPASALFSIFSDLTNFTRNLPQSAREKADIESTPDTLLASVQGMQFGIKIDDRSPFNSIRYVQYGNAPISFTMHVFFKAVSDMQTEFHIELDAELPGMIKMMFGGKIQQFVDKITDEMEKGLNGARAV